MSQNDNTNNNTNNQSNQNPQNQTELLNMLFQSLGTNTDNNVFQMPQPKYSTVNFINFTFKL